MQACLPVETSPPAVIVLSRAAPRLSAVGATRKYSLHSRPCRPAGQSSNRHRCRRCNFAALPQNIIPIPAEATWHFHQSAVFYSLVWHIRSTLGFFRKRPWIYFCNAYMVLAKRRFLCPIFEVSASAVLKEHSIDSNIIVVTIVRMSRSLIC